MIRNISIVQKGGAAAAAGSAFQLYENQLLLLTLTSRFFYGPYQPGVTPYFDVFLSDDGMRLHGKEPIKIFSDFYRLSRYHIYLSQQPADRAPPPLAVTKTLVMNRLIEWCDDSDSGCEHIFQNMNASFERLKAIMSMIVEDGAPRLFEDKSTFDPRDFPDVEIDACMSTFKITMKGIKENWPKRITPSKVNLGDLHAMAKTENINVSEQKLQQLDSDIALWTRKKNLGYFSLPLEWTTDKAKVIWVIQNEREQKHEPLITAACVALVNELNEQVKKVIEWVVSIYFSLSEKHAVEGMFSFMFNMSYSLLNSIGDGYDNFVVKNTVFEACVPSAESLAYLTEDEFRGKPGCETTFKSGEEGTCGQHCAYIERRPFNEFYNYALKDDNGIRMLESHTDICEIKLQCKELLERVVQIIEKRESGKPEDFPKAVRTLSKIPEKGKKGKGETTGLFFYIMVRSFCNDSPCMVPGSTNKEIWGIPFDRLLHLVTYYSANLDDFSKLMKGIMMDPAKSPSGLSGSARLALKEKLEGKRAALREEAYGVNSSDMKPEEKAALGRAADDIRVRLKNLESEPEGPLDNFFDGWSSDEISLWTARYYLIHLKGDVSFE